MTDLRRQVIARRNLLPLLGLLYLGCSGSTTDGSLAAVAAGAQATATAVAPVNASVVCRPVSVEEASEVTYLGFSANQAIEGVESETVSFPVRSMNAEAYSDSCFGGSAFNLTSSVRPRADGTETMMHVTLTPAEGAVTISCDWMLLPFDLKAWTEDGTIQFAASGLLGTTDAASFLFSKRFGVSSSNFLDLPEQEFELAARLHLAPTSVEFYGELNEIVFLENERSAEEILLGFPPTSRQGIVALVTRSGEGEGEGCNDVVDRL